VRQAVLDGDTAELGELLDAGLAAEAAVAALLGAAKRSPQVGADAEERAGRFLRGLAA